MDFKKNRVALAGGAFVLLLALAIWTIREHRPETSTSATKGPSFPQIKKEALDEVEIHRPNEPLIRLKKTDKTWSLTAPVQAETDETAVTAALDALGDIKVRGVAATKKENYALLEVDDAHAVRVVAKQGGKVVADFAVGAFRGGNTMIRLKDQPQVLSVSGSLKYSFNKPVRDFRNREITKFAETDVKKIRFVSSAGTFAFVRDNNTFKPDAGQKPLKDFDSGKVDAIVRSLVTLSASDFATPDVTDAQAGLDKPNATVTLSIEKDKKPLEIVLLLGKTTSSEGDVYLKRSDRPLIFTVSKFSAELMQPDEKKFAKDPPKKEGDTPPPPDMGMGNPMGGQQIPPEVMQQLQQQMGQQQQ